MSYLNSVFESFKGDRVRRANLTMQRWLDGPHGWRKQLRQIGQCAERVSKVESIRGARSMWAGMMDGYQWMYDYFIVVPLLDRTLRRAEHDDAVFRQFMNDLATLAKL